MGKPYLITYEYAAEQIQSLSKNGERINKFYIIGDNPDVDVRGANMYKETLMGLNDSRSTKTSRRQSQADALLSQSNLKAVESILVCTGVYNPQNDMLYHLKTIFDRNLSLAPEHDEPNESDGLTLVVPDRKISKKESSANFLDIEALELRDALSRKNSFISYFDNKLNIPDVTVDNLLDAVNYIVQCSKNNSS